MYTFQTKTFSTDFSYSTSTTRFGKYANFSRVIHWTVTRPVQNFYFFTIILWWRFRYKLFYPRLVVRAIYVLKLVYLKSVKTKISEGDVRTFKMLYTWDINGIYIFIFSYILVSRLFQVLLTLAYIVSNISFWFGRIQKHPYSRDLSAMIFNTSKNFNCSRRQKYLGFEKKLV